MSLALHIAHILIKNHLQTLAHTHLDVRVQHRSVYIYSVETAEQVKAYRAALTLLSQNLFMLSIANHRGKWQPVPFIGNAAELAKVLTEKFAFTLVRWP